MFILRKTTGTGIEFNISLGEYYTVALKEINPEDFAKSVALHKDEEEVKEHSMYGYVTS